MHVIFFLLAAPPQKSFRRAWNFNDKTFLRQFTFDTADLRTELAVLDRAHRGYLGFTLSKKRLGRGKQTFYFNRVRDEKSSFECVFSRGVLYLKQPFYTHFRRRSPHVSTELSYNVFKTEVITHFGSFKIWF